MTQDVRDGSHAFLYKKGSEFKPLGLTLGTNFMHSLHGGLSGRQLPNVTKHKEEHIKLKDSSDFTNNIFWWFNWTSGEENGMLKHFDLNCKYYCIKHYYFDS